MEQWNAANGCTGRLGRGCRRGVARLAAVWLVGCLAVGGGLLASAVGPHRSAAGPPGPVTKRIEDVRVGDWVLAQDPGDAGPPVPHRVEALPRNWTEHVVHVRVAGGGELQATREEGKTGQVRFSDGLKAGRVPLP